MFEKRRFVRVSIKSVAEVLLSEGEFDQAYIGGISRGGLELYTQRAMRREETYTLILHFLFEGREMTETVQGKVKWGASFKNAFVSGLEFTKVLNADEHANLLRCIEQAEAYYR